MLIIHIYLKMKSKHLQPMKGFVSYDKIMHDNAHIHQFTIYSHVNSGLMLHDILQQRGFLEINLPLCLT